MSKSETEQQRSFVLLDHELAACWRECLAAGIDPFKDSNARACIVEWGKLMKWFDSLPEVKRVDERQIDVGGKLTQIVDEWFARWFDAESDVLWERANAAVRDAAFCLRGLEEKEAIRCIARARVRGLSAAYPELLRDQAYRKLVREWLRLHDQRIETLKRLENEWSRICKEKGLRPLRRTR